MQMLRAGSHLPGGGTSPRPFRPLLKTEVRTGAKIEKSSS